MNFLVMALVIELSCGGHGSLYECGKTPMYRARDIAGAGKENKNESPVSCDLTLSVDEDRVIVRVIFKNHTSRAIRILRSTLLGDGEMSWAAFEITLDDAEVPYRGRTIKRGPPTAEDYHTLKPNETYTTTIDISKTYDLTKPGRYHLRYRSINIDPDTKNMFEIVSSRVAFKQS